MADRPLGLLPDASARDRPPAGAIGRTGERYLEDLDDGRYVALDGARVERVAAHPAFAGAARTLAGLLDLHHQPQTRAPMTSAPPGREPIPRYYSLATSAEEVCARGSCFQTVARATGGLMGRSPDFLATLLASWSAAGSVFGCRDSCYEKRVSDYHEHCASRALCHTHAISDPPGDRYGGRGGQPLTLRRVARSADGITVRGMKMLATLAPFADDLLIYPFRPLREEEADRALALAVPLNSPGLRILCRPALARAGAVFDGPLGERFDEMDALCVFDDVFVPHERVFLDGDVALANALRSETGMTSYVWHQSSVRTAVKAELILGAAALAASTSGRDGDAGVQEKLGEMAAIVEALRSMVVSAEAQAHQDRFGFHVPAWSPLAASGVLSGQMYPRLIELLQLVGSSGLIMHPSARDLAGCDAQAFYEYFGGPGGEAARHVAILKLAGELAVNGFGGRQLLYERFYLGPPDALRRRYYQGSDIAAAEALAEGLIVAAPEANGSPDPRRDAGR
jgi:aromatic ring hydroxylase